ncbi:MAG: discoidin domain-containing protein [Chloroflexales bacterium]|nr:discoidin domain-containing protein [Chloroflexales bacterium]
MSWINPNEPWSISTWLKFNSTSSSGVIAGNREGSSPGANGAFVLEKIGAKLKFSHWNKSITTSDVITQTLSPVHVVMNSDGQTMALWVNGQNVVTGTVGTGGNDAVTNNLTKLVQTGQSPTASSTATGSNRDNAADNDATTVFTTNSETNPWWQYTLSANPVRIDQIVIRNIPNSATALHRLHVMVSNDANTSFGTADSSAVWHTFITGNLGAITVLQLPYGTMGRFVRVQIEGQNEVLALPGIEINQALVVNLNSTTASIDDFRVYRHDLTPINIITLTSMSWRASALTARQDGYSWQRQLPSGLEVDAKIQSSTTDRNGNTRVGMGEQTLWDGRIDTRAPRIDAREIPIANTNLYSYTVQIDERNLNVNLLQTPCGSRFDEKLSVAPSLWYRVRSSAFDGSFIEPTHLDGSCVYGDTPDVVQQLAQPISTTKSVVFGSRYAYAGGVNTVSVIDAQNTVNLVQNSAPVEGTVMQLLMSRNKNRLYAVSTRNTPTNRAIITIFDIPTNNSTLTLRGSVVVPLAAGVTLQDSALTSYYDASVYTDNFLQLLVNSTPQQIISVQVSNPDQPTQITSTSLDASVTSYDMDASYDIVALAQGVGGVSFWQVNPNGTMQYKTSYRTGGYLNRVIFKDTTAIVLDDDEP